MDESRNRILDNSNNSLPQIPFPNDTLSPLWPTYDTYPETFYWAGPGTIAAFMFGFAFFMFMFIMIIRVSMVLSRTSANRRARMRNSAWVTTESGQGNTRRINARLIRLPQTRVTSSNGRTNQAMDEHMSTCPEAPPSYDEICFTTPPYTQNATIPPGVHHENKTDHTT